MLQVTAHFRKAPSVLDTEVDPGVFSSWGLDVILGCGGPIAALLRKGSPIFVDALKRICNTGSFGLRIVQANGVRQAVERTPEKEMQK